MASILNSSVTREIEVDRKRGVVESILFVMFTKPQAHKKKLTKEEIYIMSRLFAKSAKRLVAMLCLLVLLVGMLPLSAAAADDYTVTIKYTSFSDGMPIVLPETTYGPSTGVYVYSAGEPVPWDFTSTDPVLVEGYTSFLGMVQINNGEFLNSGTTFTNDMLEIKTENYTKDITIDFWFMPVFYTVKFLRPDGTPLASTTVSAPASFIPPINYSGLTPANLTDLVSKLAVTDEEVDVSDGSGLYRDSQLNNAWSMNTPVTSNMLLYVKTKDSGDLKVTFDTDGGAPVPAQQSVAPDGFAVEPAVPPVKSGFSFSGWYNGATAWNFTTMPVTESITLKAQWTEILHTVTFDADGGSPVPTPQTVREGLTAINPGLTFKTNNIFLGWFDDGGTGLEWDFGDPITDNITLTAHWKASLYVVTFDNDGVLSQQTVVPGASATEPTPPTKAGFVFEGWFDDDDTSLLWVFSNHIDADITLYAHWSAAPVNYVVTFDSAGGTPVPDPQIVPDGSTAFYPSLTFKDYNVLLGWFDDGGTGLEWDFGDPITGNITLTAHWKASLYVVTFNIDGVLSQQTVLPGMSAVEPIAPTKAGFIFEGWFDDDDTGLLWVFSDPINADITLYAQWSAAPATYIVTFNSDGGSVVASQVVVDGDPASEPPAPVKSGFDFDGWYDNLNNPWVFSTPITDDITLTAKWIAVTPVTFTIVYDCDGGTSDGKASWVLVVDAGAQLDRPTDPVKPGFVFGGWDYGIPPHIWVFDGPAVYEVYDNYTLTALWTPAPYDVVFYNNDGTTDSITVPVQHGDLVAPLPADPTRLNYVFEYWCEDADGLFRWNPLKPVTGPMELYAKWTPVPTLLYNVYFLGNGGTPVIDIVTVTPGSLVGEPADPYRSGYAFGGWYDSSNTLWNFTTRTVDDDTILTAKWIGNTYIVAFNSVGGSYVAPQIVNHGDLAIKPVPDPTKDGFIFGGWDDGALYLFDVPVTSNITLTARWAPEQCTVIFSGNEGTPSVTIETVPYNALAPAAPSVARAGYIWDGYWYTESTCEYRWNFAIDKVTDNITLYAGWIADAPSIPTYNVLFDTAGGSIVTPNPQVVNEGSTAAEPTTTKAGFEFGGWFTDTSYLYRFNFATTPITSNITLYAKWDPISYTVTFNSNGGSAVSPQNVPDGQYATRPYPEPTKAGLTFGGWYTDDVAFSNKWDFENTPVTSSFTLYAEWVAVPYTVKFDSVGGTPIDATFNPQIVASGHYADEPPEPTKDNYEFLGWYWDAAYTMKFEFTHPITDNMTLYALWKQTDYNINVTFTVNQGVSYAGPTLPPPYAPISKTQPVGVEYLAPLLNGDDTGDYEWDYVKINGTVVLPSSFDFVASKLYLSLSTNVWTKDLTIEYVFHVNKFNVYFDCNGGKFDNGSLTDPNNPYPSFNWPVDPGGTVADPESLGEMYRAGYIFAGWTDDETGFTWTFDTPVIKTIHLTAQWTPVYTVTYYKNSVLIPFNDGYTDLPGWTDTNPPKGGYEVGETYTQLGIGDLISTDPYGSTWEEVMNYYEFFFVGWNTKADGTGDWYEPGTYIMGGGDFAVYAIWHAYYTVTYYINDGTSIDYPDPDDPYAPGYEVIVRENGWKRTGYVFTGWNTLADGSGDAYDEFDTFTINSDVKFYAQWTPVYTVTYYKNSSLIPFDPGSGDLAGWTDTNPPKGGYEVGETFTLLGVGDLISTNGYDSTWEEVMNYYKFFFAGWNTEADGTGDWYAPGTYNMGGGDFAVYAIWRDYYSVTYYRNDGTPTYNTDTLGPYPPAAEVTVTGAVLTRPGYIFKGWNTKEDGTGDAYVGGDKFFITGDVKFYAQWEPVYTVTYYKNSALIPFETSPGVELAGWTDTNPPKGGYEVGETFTLLGAGDLLSTNPWSDTWEAVMNYNHYFFAGWNTEADGTGDWYVPDTYNMGGGDFAVYAIWRDYYSVVYYRNDGSPIDYPDPASPYAPGVEVTVGPNGWSRTGYIFSGWNTLEGGTGDAYDVGDTFIISGDVKFYAQWTPVYTVSYYGNSSDLSLYTVDVYWVDNNDPIGGYEEGEEFTLLSISVFETSDTLQTWTAIMDYCHYFFAGWNTKADGTGDWYEPGTYNMGGGDFELYAIWRDKYRVTYDGNEGALASSITEVVDPDYFNPAETYTVLNATWIYPGFSLAFAKTGYSFVGWNTLPDGSGDAYAPGSAFQFTGNVTLYAQWSRNSYHVAYYFMGSLAYINDAYIPYNAPVELANMYGLIPEGHEIEGWYYDDTGVYKWTAWDLMPAYDINLYCNLKLKTYKITFDLNGGVPDTWAGAFMSDYNDQYKDYGYTVWEPPYLPVDPNGVYNCKAWFIKGTATEWNFSDVVTGDLDLIAGWTRKTYKVTFDQYDSTTWTYAGATAFTVQYGDSVTTESTWPSPDPIKDGFIFVGWMSWYDNSVIVDPSTPITEDYLLIPKWVHVTHELTFNENDADTWSYAGPKLFVINHGWTMNEMLHTWPAPAEHPEKDRYIFAGWYDAANPAIRYYPTTPVNDDVTLIPKWNYTLTYHPAGGVGTMPVNDNSGIGHAYGAVDVAWPSSFTKDGYRFIGWDDGNGHWYNPGDSITFTDSVVLYAQWAELYSLVYFANNENDGISTGSPAIYGGYAQGDTVNVEDIIPWTKTGHTFAEWNTAPDGTGDSYDIGDTFLMPPHGVNLYAIWSRNSYRLTYNFLSMPTPPYITETTIPYGYPVTLTNMYGLIAEGWEIEGWYYENDINSPKWTASDTMPDGPRDLYCNLRLKTYTVTFDLNGGVPDTGVIPSSYNDQKIPHGNPVWLPTAPVDPNGVYDFNAWFIKGTDTKWNFGDGVTGDLDLIAGWTKKVYNVKFDSYGSTWTYTGPFEFAVQHGDTVTTEHTWPYPDPTRVGFTFAGWMSWYNSSVLVDPSTTITEDYLLIPRWIQITHELTFKENDADSWSYTGQKVFVVNHAWTMNWMGYTWPSVQPKKDGYIFADWYDENDLTTQYYPSSPVDDDVTLIPKWNYTLTYHPVGGDGTMPVNDNSGNGHAYGAVDVVWGCDFTKDGYRFIGWDDGNGHWYNPGDSITFTDSVVLYAQWVDLYSLVYLVNNENDGVSVGSPAEYPSFAQGDTVTVGSFPTWTKTGHTFVEWNTAPDGTGDSYEIGDTFLMPPHGVNLYAQWTPTEHLVKYYWSGQSIPFDQANIPYGYPITFPNLYGLIPVGYEFEGWYDYYSGLPVPAGATMPDDDLDLKCELKLKTYTVEFDKNDADDWAYSGPTEFAVYYDWSMYGMGYSWPSSPSKIGYLFVGWFDANDLDVEYSITTQVKDNVRLIPKWTLETPAVIFNPNYSDSWSYSGPLNFAINYGWTMSGMGYSIPSPDPLRDGYIFGGWVVSSTEEPFDENTPIYGATTVEPRWNFTVTYSASPLNGGIGADEVDNNGGYGYAPGSTFLAYSNTYTGYTKPESRFTSWNTGPFGYGTDFYQGSVYTITDSITLYAKWAPEHSVTYFSNNGLFDSVTDDGFLVGETVTIRDIGTSWKNPGYYFVGWDTNQYAWTPAYTAGQTFPMTVGLELYAIWRKNTYTVTFNSNGGDIDPSDLSVEHGDTWVMTVLPGTNPGYAFAGWYEAGVFYDENTPITDNVNLVARWDDYTITYKSGDGVGADEFKGPFVEGTVYYLDNEGPFTYANYEFVGWRDEATWTLYNIGDPITIDKSYIFVADWKPESRTLYYWPNDGSGIPITSEVPINTEVTVAACTFGPPLPGREFSGWNTAADGSGKWYLPGEKFTMMTSDVNLIAQWAFRVTFYADDPSFPIPVLVPENGTVSPLNTIPDPDVLPGFTFVGWFKADGVTKWDIYSDPVIGNIDLYAKVVPDPTWYFVDNFGSNTTLELSGEDQYTLTFLSGPEELESPIIIENLPDIVKVTLESLSNPLVVFTYNLVLEGYDSTGTEYTITFTAGAIYLDLAGYFDWTLRFYDASDDLLGELIITH